MLDKKLRQWWQLYKYSKYWITYIVGNFDIFLFHLFTRDKLQMIQIWFDVYLSPDEAGNTCYFDGRPRHLTTLFLTYYLLFQMVFMLFHNQNLFESLLFCIIEALPFKFEYLFYL